MIKDSSHENCTSKLPGEYLGCVRWRWTNLHRRLHSTTSVSQLLVLTRVEERRKDGRKDARWGGLNESVLKAVMAVRTIMLNMILGFIFSLLFGAESL